MGSADAVLSMHGYRVIAVDRRGHGNSEATPAGSAEVARYIGKHGNSRVAKAVLISAVTPIMLQTPAHPNGLTMDVFDGIRAGVAGIRSQFYLDLAVPFFGFNRPGAKASQGLINDFYRLGMQSDVKASHDCIKAFPETDLTADLRKITVPTPFMQATTARSSRSTCRPAKPSSWSGTGR